ncbi:VC0807 family protein [Nguyenibacter vanlangensis]|uniref:VC0807 family protein n=1 Tax=Nguyenibacter vanlangensis TaxID=1216886 RepID=A0ABZ3D289_9PROT
MTTQPAPQSSGLLAWFRRAGWKAALDVGTNIVLPVLVYDAVRPAWGAAGGLMAASLPPLLFSAGEFCLTRRIDALSFIVLAGIMLSLLALLGGGSEKFLQLREKMVTAVIGIAFLGSAAIGRPLVYPLALATLRRTAPSAAVAFQARRDHPAIRRVMLRMTLVWGAGLLADALAGVALVFALGVRAYLLVAPLLSYGSIIGLTLWTAWYRRRALTGFADIAAVPSLRRAALTADNNADKSAARSEKPA